MRRFVLSIIIFLWSFGYICYQNGIVFAGNENQNRPRIENKDVTDTTNIHYSGKYCTVCHDQIPRNGKKFLKYGEDYKQLCRCHYQMAVRDIHPSDIEPPEEFKKRMPKDFPLRKGKIACITCHDIFAQCRDVKPTDTFTRTENFLRGAPYRKLTTLCYKCHDKTKFERYNPHEQLDKNGKIITLKCLYCHKKVPDVKEAEYKDVTLIGDLVPLCVRCHNKANKGTLHASHLRKPSPKVLARIKQMEVEYGIVLPLDDDGKITCATCHNPHEKGVIPDERAGAKGAGKEHRQRLPGNLCIKCHDMGSTVGRFNR